MVYLWGLQAAICILVHVEDGKPKSVSEAADTAGPLSATQGASSGTEGHDEEINNPLIIQNSEWLQAIGNYLINCYFFF